MRLLATVYVDFFRGVPTILVIYMLGFGVPALQLSGVPTLGVLLGHRLARARLLRLRVRGVPRGHRVRASEPGGGGPLARACRGAKALRFVVVPQAVRRVVPPLLNDFIGLQKDTALVALIGPVEAFRQSQIEVARNFDYTPYFATALLFILLTIPLARLTDWLVARERRRRLALGGAA